MNAHKLSLVWQSSLKIWKEKTQKCQNKLSQKGFYNKLTELHFQ